MGEVTVPGVINLLRISGERQTKRDFCERRKQCRMTA